MGLYKIRRPTTAPHPATPPRRATACHSGAVAQQVASQDRLEETTVDLVIGDPSPPTHTAGAIPKEQRTKVGGFGCAMLTFKCGRADRKQYDARVKMWTAVDGLSYPSVDTRKPQHH